MRHRSVCAITSIKAIKLHGTSFMKQQTWAMSAGAKAAGAMTTGTMAAGVKAAGVKAAGMLATTTIGRAMVVFMGRREILFMTTISAPWALHRVSLCMYLAVRRAMPCRKFSALRF